MRSSREPAAEGIRACRCRGAEGPRDCGASLLLGRVTIGGGVPALLGPVGSDAIGVAVGTAVLSWLLAVAGALTALVRVRGDRTDRRACVRLVIATPGAVLGTVAVLIAVVLVLRHP